MLYKTLQFACVAGAASFTLPTAHVGSSQVSRTSVVEMKKKSVRALRKKSCPAWPGFLLAWPLCLSVCVHALSVLTASSPVWSLPACLPAFLLAWPAGRPICVRACALRADNVPWIVATLDAGRRPHRG